MCDSHNSASVSPTALLLFAAVAGVATGWLDIPLVNSVSEVVSDLFIRLLKLVSLPIIFFSLVATLSGMSSLNDVKSMGGKVLKYTFLTTLIAASIALLLYLLLDPSQQLHPAESNTQDAVEVVSYWSYLLTTIPTSFIAPFYENNVMGVLLLALLMSAAILSIETGHKETLHKLFNSLFAAVMKITGFVLKLMPLAVWAFVSLFVQDVQSDNSLQNLLLYLTCVLLANLIQAAVVLPLLLKCKGIPPLKTLKAMWPALTIAFFSKSSSAALPSAVECAEQRMGAHSKVVRFSMPLCISVNMNACAAFILITVLFVSQSNGVQYSIPEMIPWIVVATIAAIGNAGVPMGCYMLSSAFLAAMNIDLSLMLLILPFYSFIDMLESGINVWSDSCVTSMVHQELVSGGHLTSKTMES